MTTPSTFLLPWYWYPQSHWQYNCHMDENPCPWQMICVQSLFVKLQKKPSTRNHYFCSVHYKNLWTYPPLPTLCWTVMFHVKTKKALGRLHIFHNGSALPLSLDGRSSRLLKTFPYLGYGAKLCKGMALHQVVGECRGFKENWSQGPSL